jgi:hypothetical protein
MLILWLLRVSWGRVVIGELVETVTIFDKPPSKENRGKPQAVVPTPIVPTPPIQLLATSTDSGFFQSECNQE